MRQGIRVLGLVLAILSATACGDDAAPATSDTEGVRGPILAPVVAASLAELLGPWRAEPLGLDPAMAGRIVDRCARDMEGPPGVPPQFIDVRGAGVAMARLSGPNTAIGCDALQITANGGVEGAGGGWRSGEAEQLPGLGVTEIAAIQRSTVGGGHLEVQGWSVHGRVGNGIASVTVEPAGHPVVVATVQNGWFAAWWPARPDEIDDFERATQHPAVRIRGFGALGEPVAEEALPRGS
jgi:hypothetical protein